MEDKEAIPLVSWAPFALAPKSRYCTSVPNFLFSDIKYLLDLTTA